MKGTQAQDHEVVAGEVRALQARPGGDMALGGADLAATFMRLDLIDEYQLYVHPIVLGRGTPMFKLSEARLKLRLAGCRSFGNGVVLLRYERALGDVSKSRHPRS